MGRVIERKTMIQIEIRLNDRFVAFANVENRSTLADISDYGVEARTEPIR